MQNTKAPQSAPKPTSMALESFRCTKCGHPFGEDNPLYPKGGIAVPIEGKIIRCVKCKTAIVEYTNFRRWGAVILLGVISGLIPGSILLSALGLDERVAWILGPILGIVAGTVLEFWARADIRRRLARVAALAAAGQRRLE